MSHEHLSDQLYRLRVFAASPEQLGRSPTSAPRIDPAVSSRVQAVDVIHRHFDRPVPRGVSKAARITWIVIAAVAGTQWWCYR